MGIAPPVPEATKAEWRTWARERRRSVPDTSAAIVGHLRVFLHEHGLRRVLAYHALPGEPDVGSLADGFELYTTRARFRPHPHLTVHPWASASEVSRFGVLQPPASAPRVPLTRIQVILLPGLAFDRRGVRLGYGSGFYDRLLPEFHGWTLGVVWNELLVPRLPHEAHDCRVQGLVTPFGIQTAGSD